MLGDVIMQHTGRGCCCYVTEFESESNGFSQFFLKFLACSTKTKMRWIAKYLCSDRLNTKMQFSLNLTEMNLCV